MGGQVEILFGSTQFEVSMGHLGREVPKEFRKASLRGTKNENQNYSLKDADRGGG